MFACRSGKVTFVPPLLSERNRAKLTIRVYHQNYDLFYSVSQYVLGDLSIDLDKDVTKFHSDLRRMVITEFGNHAGPNGQPVGLDLVGDGKAK